jgi:hypothetical protein
MGKFGKGMAPLSSQTSELKRAYLDTRAERLNWTRSEVLTKVIDYWLAMGAPALSELDAPLPVPAAVISELPSHWARYTGKPVEVVHSRIRH